MQVLFYCYFLYVLSCNKSVLLKPVLIKSFEVKRPAQNAESCSKVAEHNLFMRPSRGMSQHELD